METYHLFTRRAGLRPTLAGGTKAEIAFHAAPDGAAVIELSDGRYAYVSNSEVAEGGGGVYAMYFDRYGNVDDYKQLLSGTTRNCSGGTTPWNTWVSCEETGRGQVSTHGIPAEPNSPTPSLTSASPLSVLASRSRPVQPILRHSSGNEARRRGRKLRGSSRRQYQSKAADILPHRGSRVWGPAQIHTSPKSRQGSRVENLARQRRYHAILGIS